MALSLAEMKDLVTFVHAMGAVAVKYGDLEVHFGLGQSVIATKTLPEDSQEQDNNTSGLPEDFRHYSAQGKAAWGKVP